MASRAELVNGALEAAVPLQYPEDVVEAMRYDHRSRMQLYSATESTHRHFTFLLSDWPSTSAHPTARCKAQQSAVHVVGCYLCSIKLALQFLQVLFASRGKADKTCIVSSSL